MKDMVSNNIELRRKTISSQKVESLTGEIWFDIPLYEGYYKISNFFRIKSVFRICQRNDGVSIAKPEQLRKTSINKCGYLEIILTKDGVSKTISVHRIMADVFVPNPNNLPEVNHIDGNKLNCYPSNLEWVTRKYNMNHAVTNGLRVYTKGVNCGKYKVSTQDVIDIYNSKESTSMLVKKYPLTRSSIQRIRSGKTYKSLLNGLNK